MAPVNQLCLNFEVEHVVPIRIAGRKRRERQRTSRIDRLTGIINGLLEGAHYDVAAKHCEQGLMDFPGDEELIEWDNLIGKCKANRWSAIGANFLCIILYLHQKVMALEDALEEIKNILLDSRCCPVCSMSQEGVFGLIHHAAVKHFDEKVKPFACILPCGVETESFIHHEDLMKHLKAMLESKDKTHEANEIDIVLEMFQSN